MRRLDFRPVASTALAAAVLVYVGCSADPPAHNEPATGNTAGAGTPDPAKAAAKADQTASPIDKLMAELNNPAAVLLVSGQQSGYLEPCGCSAEQVGGLLRRFDFVERLRKQNWPVSLVEMGGLIKDPHARGGLEQNKIKFDHALKALKLLGYDALALSADDLKVGVGEALGLFDNNLGEKTKIVVANVQPEQFYKELFRRSIVVTAGPVKLGITAVIDPEAIQKLSDPEKDVLLTAIKPPEEVLPRELADLETKSDYQVLLVQGPPAMAKRLGQANPGFDVVVATSDFVDPLSREPELLGGGKTMLITTGKKGKYVGVISIHPREASPLRFQLVTLNRRFDGPAAPMKALIEDEYRQTLKSLGVVENFVKINVVNGAPGATFAGAATCKNCHPNTFNKWSTTKHKQAFEALLNDPKPNTAFDAECVTCHTTGFEYNSGWKSEKETPHLAGNQCENCHGPASRHIADPDNAALRKLLHRDAEQAEKSQLCYNCHDEDNSREFEFKNFYGKIVHKGLDTYTDPKVHKGLTPRAAKPAATGASK
jgi:Cytochrome c554 and c-prime